MNSDKKEKLIPFSDGVSFVFMCKKAQKLQFNYGQIFMKVGTREKNYKKRALTTRLSCRGSRLVGTTGLDGARLRFAVAATIEIGFADAGSRPVFKFQTTKKDK